MIKVVLVTHISPCDGYEHLHFHIKTADDETTDNGLTVLGNPPAGFSIVKMRGDWSAVSPPQLWTIKKSRKKVDDQDAWVRVED